MVNGGDIEQGDVIENCPVLILPPDVTLYSPDPRNRHMRYLLRQET
jgi:hypothetical protein